MLIKQVSVLIRSISVIRVPFYQEFIKPQLQAKQFIFSNKPSYRIARHTAFWIARLIIVALIHSLWNSETFPAVFENLGKEINHFLPQMIVTEMPYCYFVIYFLRPKYLSKNRYGAFILSFIIVTGLDIILLLFYFYLRDNLKLSQVPYLFLDISKNYLLIQAPVACGIFLAIKLFKTLYLKEEEKQMLVKASTDAELDLLKAQIQPHFLFNTLNNIYSFTLSKSPKAKDLVSYLSNIMKYMVNDCNVEFIALSKEIKILRDYIELEKVRYSDLLDIKIEVSGNYTDKAIAPLLMIPFVENSFKHGTSKMLSAAWINLFIQVDENMLHFSLTNNKPANETVNGKNGIGLINVKKRLALLYREDHLLTIESTANTFTVNMQVPLKQMSSAGEQLIDEVMAV